MVAAVRPDETEAAGDLLAASPDAVGLEPRAASLVEAAVRYARLGYRVFPIIPGSKKPYTAHGFKDATTDEGLVQAWWQQWPGALIATPDTCTVDIEAVKPGRNGGPPGPDGWASWRALTAEHGVPDAPATRTGRYGGARGGQLHFAPREDVRTGELAPGVELRAHGAYVLLPPSTHPTSVEYEGELPPRSELPPLPEWAAELRRGKRRRGGGGEPTRAEPLPPVIRDGQWHRVMVSAAGRMLRGGLTEDAAVAALVVQNVGTYEGTPPPDSDAEIAALVRDVYGRYEPGELIPLERAYAVEARALDDVVATFSRWLELPDVVPVYAMLGAVAGNYLPGAPVWLVIVSPPSSGKTELLGSLARLPDTYPVSTLTVPALLSGTPGKERARTAKGGLLRELGDFGIVVLRDMGSLLSLRPDAKAEVFAALREVFDGAYVRYVGAEGGRQLSWTGKVGLVAGATPVLDRHHSVLGVMGERFLLCRLPEALERQAERALEHAGELEAQMRQELVVAVAALFAGERQTPRPLSAEERSELVRLAALVARARSPVERDRYSREVELIPGAEGPARLAVTLERLLAGLDSLGCERELALRVIRRVALDSMPQLRRALLEQLRSTTATVATTELALATGTPTNTVRRALEELAAYRLVLREKQGPGKPDVWSSTGWTRERLPHPQYLSKRDSDKSIDGYKAGELTLDEALRDEQLRALHVDPFAREVES
jgi:hypothetical protein